MGKGDTLDEMAMEKVVDLLENKGFKNKLIKKLNDAVDIPLINEKTEKKVLDSIYKLLLETIKEL
jgi:ornithine carbamoyltransferase